MSALFGGKDKIFDTMIAFFKEDDWKYHELEGKSAVELGFKGENGSWRCYARANEEKGQFTFYSIFESNVPDPKRHIVAEFLTRANYGLTIGNFEMDFSDGEVRYKTSVDVKGGQLTTEMVKTLVYVNCLMADKYFPGLMAVIHAGTTPAAAIAKVEG